MTLTHEHYLASLRRDGADLAEAAKGNLGASVPGCPEWNVAELVEHTGKVHRFWTKIANGLEDPRTAERETPPAPELVIEWYLEGLERLIDTLETVDASRPIWTWAPVENPTASWIVRRMTQETAVHRYDAQSASGPAAPIEVELAADGIDELLFVFLPARPELHRGSGETAHVHCTDAAGEWFVVLDDGEYRVSREHAKGDVALRGGASDLLLVLWSRRPPSTVEVLGDEKVAAALVEAIDRS